jgi:hypothetical protein
MQLQMAHHHLYMRRDIHRYLLVGSVLLISTASASWNKHPFLVKQQPFSSIMSRAAVVANKTPGTTTP